MKNKVIEVQNVQISISKQELDDYICITDIAKAKSGDSRCADIVKNWLRNRNTLEFLGTWEKIYNSDFKVVEFDHFKAEAGLHTFVLSAAEWINVRDFATINELTVLSNLESHNAQMLREGKEKEERFKILQEIAEYQLNVLNAAEEIKMIESDGALSEV